MSKPLDDLDTSNQEHDVQSAPDSESSDVESKREFLAIASKFSAIVAILGLSADVLAEKELNPKLKLAPKLGPNDASAFKGNTKSVADLLRTAIQTGDMEGTLKRYEGKVQLNNAQLQALRSLSRQDLNLLRSLKTKLAPLRGKISGGDKVLY